MPINTDDLTTKDINGTGTFDVLMKTAALHLKREFDANRIRGNDYTQAYIATIGQAMSVAASYATTKPLSDQQVINAVEDNRKTTYEIDNILPKQAEQITAGTNKINFEVNDLMPKQSLILGSENVKISNENTKLIRESNLLTEQLNLAQGQVLKVAEETSLLTQKKLTEEAQILDNVNSNPVAGVIGKQLELYTQQAKGYEVDQVTKVAKLHADVTNLQLNVNENYNTSGTGFEDANGNAVMVKLRQTIGVS